MATTKKTTSPYGAQPSLSALANRSAAYKSQPIVVGVRGGQNLTSGGYPSSTSGYSTTGTNNAPKYNQGISGYSSSGSTSGSSGSGSSSKKSTASTSSSRYSYTAPSYNSNDYDLITGNYIGGGSTPEATSNFDYSGAYRKLLEAYQGRQGEYQSYLDQMNELAQNAYDRGMSSLNDTYGEQMNLLRSSYQNQQNTLKSNLDRALQSLLDTYNNSKKTVSSDAENSLKQAYLSNMLAKRDIAQRLSAMGLNGGMTETTLAGLANQYGNNRNDINKALNTNLANLATGYSKDRSNVEGNYASELANALSSYNNAIANANAQKLAQVIALEDALAGNKMNAYSNYQSMLSDYNKNYYDLLRSAIADEVDLL